MKGFYQVVFAPQDTLIRGWNDARFAAITRGARPDQLEGAALAYNPPRILDFSMNMGLSTQLLIAGLCIWLGHPLWYVYTLYLEGALLLVLQFYREWRTVQHLKNT